jgi:hypothetical protein
MNLEVSAVFLLELHRALEADRRREMRNALIRGAMFEALASEADDSADVAGVPIGDRSGSRHHPGADLGWGQDLDPAPGTQQRAMGLVRPIQSQPEP